MERGVRARMLTPHPTFPSTYFHQVLAQESKVGDNGRLPTIFWANLPEKASTIRSKSSCRCTEWIGIQNETHVPTLENSPRPYPRLSDSHENPWRACRHQRAPCQRPQTPGCLIRLGSVLFRTCSGSKPDPSFRPPWRANWGCAPRTSRCTAASLRKFTPPQCLTPRRATP